MPLTSGSTRPARRPRASHAFFLLLLLVLLISMGGVRRPPSDAELPVRPLRVLTRDTHRPASTAESSTSHRDPTPPRRVERPTGRLRVVGGRTPREKGRPQLVRFLVEVEGGLRTNRAEFAAYVERVLRDRRSWGGGRVSFRRVSTPPVRFRVTLASPKTTDRLCAPLDTKGIYSCHQDGRAVLNLMRWRRGAFPYRGNLAGYRTYLINHEVGHALGYSAHGACPATGARAPVMVQQTKGVAPCEPNPWPLAAERAVVF